MFWITLLLSHGLRDQENGGLEALAAEKSLRVAMFSPLLSRQKLKTVAARNV